MNEELEAALPAAVVETEQAVTVETTSTEATPEQTQETIQANESDAPKKEPWFQKRIGELTREKYEARREADEARQEAAQIREQIARQQQGDDTQPIGNVQAFVKQEAARQVAEQRFNEACDKVYATGKTEFPDFDAAVSNLQLVGVGREFLELASTSDAGAKLIHHLGTDLDEAARIASLPPLQMAREMTRLEIKLSQVRPKPVSNAPAPITPVGGGAVSSGLDDNLSTDEWLRRRNKQLQR